MVTRDEVDAIFSNEMTHIQLDSSGASASKGQQSMPSLTSVDVSMNPLDCADPATQQVDRFALSFALFARRKKQQLKKKESRFVAKFFAMPSIRFPRHRKVVRKAF